MMNSLMQAKNWLILLGVALIICACGGGGGGGGSSSANSNSNDNLIDPVAKGNGVWDYSVATDYYYGTKNPVESPSLNYDLTVAYQTSTIQFVFPVFSTLDAPNGVISVESSDYVTVCPDQEKPTATQMLNYYALPQLKDSYLNTAMVLGTCVDGESVTTYYSGFISHVVPVVEITAQLGAALGAASADTVAAVAANVAAIINNDPNAYGVAFDNEPLLSKEGTNSTTTAGTQMERNFYGELAYQLALHKKYLFLFDGATTAAYLQENGYNGSNLNNIIIEQYLYDLDTTTSNQSAGPVSLESYETLANHEASKDLAAPLSNNPPLRFVLPASATSTMWDYLQGYNMLATGIPYVAPTTLTNTSACHTADGLTPGTIDNGALSAFLCSPSGVCPGVPGAVAQAIITEFLGSQNCVNYTNYNMMYQYFNASLSAVSQANAFTNSRYFGSDLYAWRISAYSDINASKGYYNQNGGTKYESSTQLFPAEITPIVWESFIGWSSSND